MHSAVPHLHLDSLAELIYRNNHCWRDRAPLSLHPSLWTLMKSTPVVKGVDPQIIIQHNLSSARSMSRNQTGRVPGGCPEFAVGSKLVEGWQGCGLGPCPRASFPRWSCLCLTEAQLGLTHQMKWQAQLWSLEGKWQRAEHELPLVI